jgi:hypothetical protein
VNNPNYILGENERHHAKYYMMYFETLLGGWLATGEFCNTLREAYELASNENRANW